MRRGSISSKYVAAAVFGVALVGATAATPASGQTFFDGRLTVHGYLTQGFGGSTDVPVIGLTDELTADYRAAALQARLRLFESGSVVVQGAHRRVGGSWINDMGGEAEVDWAFYEQKLGALSVRVGRVPMPAGIYNEIRDVGVLLPFFRAPYAMYMDGIETVDGGVVTYRANPGSWGFQAQAYGGSWDLYFDGLEDTAEKVAGGQGWVHLPVDGLRAGVSVQRYEFDEPVLTGTTGSHAGFQWKASADLTRERFFVRGEYLETTPGAFDLIAYFGQAGLEVLPKLDVNVQAEASDLHITIPGIGPFDMKQTQDYAVGASYRVSHMLVLKAEAHTMEGYSVDVDPFPLMAQGIVPSTEYFITSVSVAF